MMGSFSMIGWSASTLQSSTRSGLVSARRWQSPHIVGGHGLQRLAQPFDKLRPAVVIAHRIDHQLESESPARLENLHHHLDHFGIHRRRFRADGFRADLEELPVAALLRPLAAEHGADVVELLHAGALVEPVLDVGADHRRGVLRPQRERRAVAVLERVHFLADDVGIRAHAAREELRLLEIGVRISL